MKRARDDDFRELLYAFLSQAKVWIRAHVLKFPFREISNFGFTVFPTLAICLGFHFLKFCIIFFLFYRSSTVCKCQVNNELSQLATCLFPAFIIWICGSLPSITLRLANAIAIEKRGKENLLENSKINKTHSCQISFQICLSKCQNLCTWKNSCFSYIVGVLNFIHCF